LETFNGKSILKITLELKKVQFGCKRHEWKKNHEESNYHNKRSGHHWRKFWHEKNEWKKNPEEFKDLNERCGGHHWRKFWHEKRNREGNENDLFWKKMREKKILEVEKLKEDKVYEKEITELNSMGYNDEFLNYRLLQRYDGNVKRVVSKILKKNNRREKWGKHFKKEIKNEGKDIKENEVNNESLQKEQKINEEKIDNLDIKIENGEKPSEEKKRRNSQRNN